MSRHQIAVVVGSLRCVSATRRFADAIVRLAPTEISLKQTQIGFAALLAGHQYRDGQQAVSSSLDEPLCSLGKAA